MRINKGMSFVEEYSFLSNMYLLDKKYQIKWVSSEGKEYIYPSSENFYQAMKSNNSKVWDIFQRISPHKSKNFSKNIDLVENWEIKKKQIMWYALTEKFKDPKLLKKLLEIEGDIIEYNYWNDKYWGVCSRTFEGKNILGKMLMKIREINQI